MKKFAKHLILVLLSLTMVFALFACADADEEPTPEQEQQSQTEDEDLSFERVYAYAQTAGYTGTLEELIEAFKGESAYQIAVNHGYKGTEEEWLTSLKGLDGQDGSDGKDGVDGKNGTNGENGTNGITPHIGDNNNWYVGDTDTGIYAKGQEGKSISNININSNNELIISFTDGSETSLGTVFKSALHSHDIIEKTIVSSEATCENVGSKFVVCETCGEVLRYEIIPKLEHDYVVNVVPMTCKSDGYTEHICKNCDYSYKTDFVDADPVEGHTFEEEYTYDTNQHWLVPTCGHVSALVKSNHCYDENGVCKVCGFDSLNAGTFSFIQIEGRDEYAVEAITSSMTVNAVIPSTYNGYPVTRINEYAFFENSVLETITVPDSIKRINIGAFKQCTKLKSVALSKEITFIADDLFYGSTALESIVIPAKVKTIGTNAFNGCSALQYVTLQEENVLNSVGTDAFINCSALKGVNVADVDLWFNITFANENANPLTIAKKMYSNNELVTQITTPSSITAINSYAFYNCESLENVSVTQNIKNIDYRAFYSCTGIKYLSLAVGLEYIGESAFESCTSLIRVTIPGSVNTIDTFAFIKCTSLVSVLFNNGVISIGRSSFEQCSKLTSITIPSSVEYIGFYVFNECWNLSILTFEDTNNWYKIYCSNYNGYNNWKNKTNGETVEASEFSDASSNANEFRNGNDVGRYGLYYLYKHNAE